MLHSQRGGGDFMAAGLAAIAQPNYRGTPLAPQRNHCSDCRFTLTGTSLTGDHAGRYNAPTTDDIAVLMVDDSHKKRDIILQYRGGALKRVDELHRSYDPLQYPILFALGTDGYCLTILKVG